MKSKFFWLADGVGGDKIELMSGMKPSPAAVDGNLNERAPAMSRTLLALCLACALSALAAAQQAAGPLGRLSWVSDGEVLRIDGSKLPESADNPWLAVKDPSIVRHEGRWHLFCTLRKTRGGDGKPPGYVRVGHLSFADWPEAQGTRWTLLELSGQPGYHGAPQVFFHRGRGLWFLVLQFADPARGIPFGPCYSTTRNIADPASWSRPTPFYTAKPDNLRGWLDFWVICDEAKAHLFFTSLDGRMWRAETAAERFPEGYGRPQVALQGDIFEASHTYRMRRSGRYLTIIEAQGQSAGRGRRYYKGYVADRLDGPWTPATAHPRDVFAAAENIVFQEPWTGSVSHGELLRAGNDERMEIDEADMTFLIQGLPDAEWTASYGKLPWRLGLLRRAGAK